MYYICILVNLSVCQGFVISFLSKVTARLFSPNTTGNPSVVTNFLKFKPTELVIYFFSFQNTSVVFVLCIGNKPRKKSSISEIAIRKLINNLSQRNSIYHCSHIYKYLQNIQTITSSKTSFKRGVDKYKVNKHQQTIFN